MTLRQRVAALKKFWWKHKYFLWKTKLFLTFIWSHWKLTALFFPPLLFFRDADGDVDTCPMWTFPTVRPTSMNKLQKGYTHTDSEVRPRPGQIHTCTYYYFFFSPKSFHSLFVVRRFSEKTTKVSIFVCFGHAHFQRGTRHHWKWDHTSNTNTFHNVHWCIIF